MLPTVTIESTRFVTAFDLELLLGVLSVVAVVAWMTMTRLRQHRHR
jgi:hypothetical protein